MNEFSDKKGVEPSRINQIRENIRSGEAWLKQGNYRKKDHRWAQWKKNKSYLQCQWDVEGVEKTEFHVNTIFSNYHTIKPALIFKTPYINCTATKPEFHRDDNGDIKTDEMGRPQVKSDNYIAARLMQVRINHELKQIQFKNILKRVTGDCLAPYGIGWIKIGYQEKSISSTNNDRNNSQNYWMCRKDPRDIVFDWMATEIQECRWIAERICMPRSEVEEFGFKIPPNYTGQLPEHLLERQKLATDSQVTGARQGSSEEMVVFWEYHDLINRTIDWVIIDGPGKEWFFMSATSVDPYPFEGSCYIPLVLTPDNDDIIGLSDVEPIEEQALALNRMRTREVHHIDNYGTGIIYEDGAVSPDELKKVKRTPYGWYLKANVGGFNKIKTQGTPSLGSDHYNMSQIHKEEIRTTLGITDYQQGGGAQQRLATEANIIRSDATIRVEDKRDIIADFVIECVRRLAAMIQEFDAEEDFIPLASEELDEDFVEVLKTEYNYNPKLPFLSMGRKDIQGEFNFSFNVEDMIMQPKEVRAAQLAKSLQAIGSNPVFTQKFMEDYDIGDVIVEMFELNGVDIEKFKKGGPAQISPIVENEMFKRGMEVPEPHRKDEFFEHIPIHNQLKREKEEELRGLQAAMQKLQMGLQMIPEMAASDPMMGQEAQQRAQQEMNAILQKMDLVQAMLRRVTLHLQAHEAQEMRKNAFDGAAGGGAGLGPQTGLPAQAPNPVDVNQGAMPEAGGMPT